jgi:hypothetical protein
VLPLLVLSTVAGAQTVSIRLTRADDSTRAGQAHIEIRGWRLLSSDSAASRGAGDEVDLPSTIDLIGWGSQPAIFAAVDSATPIRVAVTWKVRCQPPGWLPTPLHVLVRCKSNVRTVASGLVIELLVDEQGPHVRSSGSRTREDENRL